MLSLKKTHPIVLITILLSTMPSFADTVNHEESFIHREILNKVFQSEKPTTRENLFLMLRHHPFTISMLLPGKKAWL